MAKDPAFLFYSNDFLQGVSDMDFCEIGEYITMLSRQHQEGFVSERWLKKNIPNVSKFVLSKFSKDDKGSYQNSRLSYEIEKRQKHSERQRENIKKRWGSDTKAHTKPIPTSYQKDTKKIPLENEDENVNEIEDVIRDVIEILNTTAKKQFDSSAQSHRQFISARIKDGATPHDLALVIEYKCAEWMGRKKSEAWLRPKTLFNSTNFQIYLDESRNYKANGVSPDGVRGKSSQDTSRLAELHRAAHGKG